MRRASFFDMLTGLPSGGETITCIRLQHTCPMCAGPIPIDSDRLTCSSRCRSRKSYFNRHKRPLTVGEVASRAGLAYSTVLRLIKRGELERMCAEAMHTCNEAMHTCNDHTHTRIGKPILIPRAAADKFVKRRYPKLAKRKVL